MRAVHLPFQAANQGPLCRSVLVLLFEEEEELFDRFYVGLISPEPEALKLKERLLS